MDRYLSPPAFASSYWLGEGYSSQWVADKLAERYPQLSESERREALGFAESMISSARDLHNKSEGEGVGDTGAPCFSGGDKYNVVTRVGWITPGGQARSAEIVIQATRNEAIGSLYGRARGWAEWSESPGGSPTPDSPNGRFQEGSLNISFERIWCT